MAKKKAGEGPTDQQWGHAMSLWVTTDLSAIRIGEEIGVSEGAVRKRAKRDGWGPRNAPERKRALVAAAAAGTKVGTSLVPRTDAEKGILDAADQDIHVMQTAANVARIALERCEALIPQTGDPRDIKILVEAARGAMETYRKARNLDEPSGQEAPTPYSSMSDADLEEMIARAVGKG